MNEIQFQNVGYQLRLIFLYINQTQLNVDNSDVKRQDCQQSGFVSNKK